MMTGPDAGNALDACEKSQAPTEGERAQVLRPPILDLPGIRLRLERDGCLWFGKATFDAADLARTLGTVRRHRDGSVDGATVIRPKPHHLSVGDAFTRRGLPPHTDGSGIRLPPDLVLNQVIRAGVGGDTTLVDGEAVLAAIARSDPATVRQLATPMYMFGVDRLRAPILSVHPVRKTLCLRYRDDGLLVPLNIESRRAFHVLQMTIGEHLGRRPLTHGETYLIDNTRFLHGRTAFSGDRIVVRHLIDAPDLRLGIYYRLQADMLDR